MEIAFFILFVCFCYSCFLLPFRLKDLLEEVKKIRSLLEERKKQAT